MTFPFTSIKEGGRYCIILKFCTLLDYYGQFVHFNLKAGVITFNFNIAQFNGYYGPIKGHYTCKINFASTALKTKIRTNGQIVLYHTFRFNINLSTGLRPCSTTLLQKLHFRMVWDLDINSYDKTFFPFRIYHLFLFGSNPWYTSSLYMLNSNF